MVTARARDLRPFVLACVVAVASVGMLWLAVVHGWLGPDVGRGDRFCEAARDGDVLQPANTFSNAGFVLAGLAIGWRAGHPRTTIAANPRLASAYGVVVVLLGPASAAMHATQSALGGHLDLLSMYLVAGFASAYAVTRVLGRGTAFFAVLFIAAVGVCEVVERVPGHVPMVDIAANLAFGLLLLVALAGEAVLWRRGGASRQVGWGFASAGALALAFAIWNLAKDGSSFCQPQSLVQGHAAWHLLCAVAAYCLYRLYASERVSGAA
ncbi:Ceramidase [Pedococcus dokdonensis]|uniref:Ceramidase n=1 Tax=Pedococcus dokdonensis TaxID=443156 RepID=A0A1H0LUH0_9MICO|nr:Ceramidase [Pedococcus dokdonensis]